MSFAIGSLRPRAALAPLQNASCQCRHASSRSITVRLVRTIDGLGKGNELVQVNPGRMRHSLFPEGKAVYVPWKRKSVLKAMIADKNASSSTPTAPNPQTTQTPSTPLLSKSEWTTTSSLIPLSFTLPVPASSSTETLFGSIHPSDLARYFQFELQAENQIPVESLDFAWTEKEKEKGRVEAGERVRKLGRYTYTVGVKGDRNGSMKVEREVELVPQEAPTSAATTS